MEPHDILIVEAPDTRTKLYLGYCGDLVHHQAAARPETVACIRLDRQTEQRRLRRIGSEGANSERIRGVEAIILQDRDGTRLARITLAGRNAPNLATLHASSRRAL